MTSACRFAEGRGRVATFDDAAGWGTVEVAPGDLSGGQPEQLFFHCTAIADGSRTIPTGTDVRFAVVAGTAGQWEAAGVRAER